jgi:xenotropic and polytropic retrovirus receptor 1
VAGFALASVVIFMSLCFSPFHCFYKRARKELLIVLWNILISPFGLVKFKHFFLADILTSFVIPLKDVGIMVCFFASKLWLESETADTNAFPGLVYYLMIIPVLPFWFRFAQCLVRYRETELTANLINAGKYISSLLVQVMGAIKTWNGKIDDWLWWTILGVSLFSTIYSLYWDYKMDWGLFRET